MRWIVGILINAIIFVAISGFSKEFFYISGFGTAIGASIILSLLNNLRHIHLAKPIELLRGGQVGEKEPKTKWILVIIGVAALASGYYIALVTESPLVALNKFYAVIFF